MKVTVFILILLLAIAPVAKGQSTDVAGLKSIAKFLERTEKETKNKTVRDQVRRSRKHVERIQELWGIGAIPNSLGLLLEVRTNLYRLGASGSLDFQQKMKLTMTRLWPFLIKTKRFRTDSQTLSGVTLVRLIFPEGTYTMLFPMDAKPGETVSGRISATPGTSASLYVLTVMGSPALADGSLRKWQLPESFDMVLSDPWGNEIVRATHKLTADVPQQASAPSDPRLQEEKQPIEPKPNIEIPHLRFEISSKAKAGGHLIIKGPFDGDFSNTNVDIGKYEAHILTESPGRLILAVHPQMTGDWTILIHENDNWARCRVRVQSDEVDPFATLSTCTPPA